MRTRSYSHFDDKDLLQRLDVLAANERTATAELVACIAEVERRQLFLAAGYSCMHAYCVGHLGLSGDAAFRRARAARTALEHSAIFDALADGRLHLTAVVLLAPHLRELEPEIAAELLQAAEHKSKFEIQMLIAERFPQADLPTSVAPVAERAAQTRLAPAPVDGTEAGHSTGQASCGLAPAPVMGSAPYATVTPLSPQRLAFRATITRKAYEKLLYAQTLLSHAVPSGDLAEVVERAIDALVTQAEKQKLGPASRLRPGRSSSTDPRYIAPEVRREVWVRDGGRCAFIGEGGHRCGATKRLEFHHDDPVAMGGEATVDQVQLLCRAHNQYEAECDFGAGFMAMKRETARTAAAEKRAQREAERAAEAERAKIEKDPDRSVVPWLRHMGCRLEEAREAAACCESLPPATSLEDKIRAALRFLAARRGVVKAARPAA